jgi:CRISPR-associated protein, Cas2 family
LLVLVSYDVSTKEPGGQGRLRRVAKTCLSFGQRVQNSVFECVVGPKEWTQLKLKLLDVYDPASDSLRFYFLGADYRRRIEHHGAKPALDLEGPLLA